MSDRVAFIFFRPGFNFTDIKHLDGICFPDDVREVYADVFGRTLTPIDALTAEIYWKK